MSDRTPPHDIQAEQATLGGLMTAPNAVEQATLLADVQGILVGPGDFYRPAHQIIYEALCALGTRGEPLDVISVSNELARRGDLGRVGNGSYLHDCTEAIPHWANTGHYAKIVADRAVLRRLVEVGTRIAQFGYEGQGEVDALVDAARACVMEMATSSADHHGDLEHILDADAWEALIDEMQRGSDDAENRVPTGFADLDALLGGGFERGQLIVVGARPALGKSTVALDMSRGAVKAGHHAAFFGLEMTNKELRLRWLSAEAKVPLHSIRAGGDMLDDEMWTRIAMVKGQRETEGHHLWVADKCTTVAQIRANCRRYQARTGRLDMVVVDYLQLIPSGADAESRQVAVSEASRSLKLMAKELGVVVVMLSQLNRNPEQRQDKKPHLSDLRESGAVEQDADVVILLYREDVHDKESPRAGEADLIVAKHRNGPTAEVTVAFQGHYSRFVDMAPV
ncbi:replicative DNA helicase [Nocardiopsis dassonvillei]|uniref:replicative DNA helicase n=1 Tax=Nocardiopsis dassonvillei TaxID=2014 RepID=UPI00157DF7FB|nr:replicative DNA helicase [Nocardiopsis dassonvillei]